MGGNPGVVDVMTPNQKPKLAQDPDEKSNPFMFRLDLCKTTSVRYANQPIAVVIAETLEAATEGAVLLAPRYEPEPARVGLDATNDLFRRASASVTRPRPIEAMSKPVWPRRRSGSRRPPRPRRNIIMRWSRMRSWPRGTAIRLSLDTPSQGLAMAQGRLAGLFGISPDHIHIRSPFLGGGFGSKGFISGPQVLGIMAARLVGKPVKLYAPPQADVRSGRSIARQRARPCGSVPAKTAN